jgi:hypothetical protein
LRSATAHRVALSRKNRVDKLSTVRFGSARYSLPRHLVGRDVMVVPAEGQVSIEEAFLRAAAGAGTNKLGTELAAIAGLEAAWGRDALVAALERAITFRRFKAGDVRSILAAGLGAPGIAAEGAPLDIGLPPAPTRDLAAYDLERFA